MPPIDGAASTLLGQWGPAGAIIIALGAALVTLFKHFQHQAKRILEDEKAERAEMRKAHAEERAEMRNIGAQRHEQLVDLTKEATAAMRATEQVLRELTGELGAIRAQTRER